ncbi:MAG: fluoride efflux transporter CrcB [Desulfobacula sp.]|uniref:fluoride efflux transporter CrcB n=1 Tax=Desulfobacula sp. TaxID=2593537 RepID=UPI001E092141|nr:fluoride efflux transporter CrcB [Desulfobacula sp.]MBT3486047.1 fluoride efflux transporter CrcB [Desulfobacula sp.]MBT3804984.1 fluoride efflux transporter CrcB [Desulfobacula sp.]MBT4025472.1 fluoride efflux transporter CrcB [Desulfobacula sp.]MBT4198742.1 fluoride efflux transporter CrcB [Desulfobacula sp.]
MIKILMVGVGGAAGSICRYIISDLSHRLFNDPFFPYGTITVNVAGCFLIGLIGGLSDARQIFTPEIRALILIGFLGGFTTFSTFGYEIFTVARDGQFVSALTNLMLHLILGFGSVWLGFSMSRLL